MRYAHISEDGRRQTIKEHLEHTAELAAEFAEPFGMKDSAYVAGLLHDIGKYSDAFQKRLEGGPKVDHSTAGSYEAYKHRLPMESFAIAGHHSGLPNGGGRADLEGASLLARMNKARLGGIESYDDWRNEIVVPEIQPESGRDKLESWFKIKMLFSCLVDADYLDTEAFMLGQIERGHDSTMDEIMQKFRDYIMKWFPAKNKLNELRCEILSHVIREGEACSPGLYTLTVPTGGGKTVASLAFAIEHARKNGLKRIIYVIPYTSIIEQTADVFRNILGSDIVLEHHSNVDYENIEDYANCRATENWDIPVIVTTNVQFFESFYKNKSSSSRKLHNVANSVIIFDEAQMIPIEYIDPCVALMTELVGRFSASVVLCTATQPSLGPVIDKFMGTYRPRELCPKEYYDNDLFKRASYVFIGELTVENLVSRAMNYDQFLCIVNSKKAAQIIFNALNSEGTFHLSTNMYPEHRRKVLREIRCRLENGQLCRVISTSLIEAGVDVDFPCVFRQIAGIDSLLQAGGRCNREGKRKIEDSIVYVFDLPTGSPELFSAQIAASKEVLESHSAIDSKEAIEGYFNNLFYLKGQKALDQYEIVASIQKDNFPFTEVSERFNLIESNTRTLYIANVDNQELIDRLFSGAISKSELRKLGTYSVNIYETQYRLLKARSALIELENGICILGDSSMYSDKIGLMSEHEAGEAIII